MAITVSNEALYSMQRRGERNPNPYFARVASQGIPISIDEAFLLGHFSLKRDDGRSLGRDRDPKTGLITENDELRNGLALAFTDCVRRGEKWAILTIDLDQLKRANTEVDHLFGDIFIRWSAIQVVNALRKNKKGEELLGKTIVYKPSKTSDEIKVIFLGVDDEEIKVINQMSTSFNTTTQDVEVERKKGQDSNLKGPFVFSISAGIVTSEDERIQEASEQTREHRELEVFWGLFNFVDDLSDTLASEKKLGKDIYLFQKRLTEIKSPNDIAEFNNWMVKEYGDGRIRSLVLHMILELAEILVLRHLIDNHLEAIELLLKHKGITIEELNNINNIPTLHEIFTKFFNAAIEDHYQGLLEKYM